MRSWRWVLPLILAGIHACSREAPAPGNAGQDASRARAPADDALPSVTAEQLIAKVRALHARAVLVNAWATWCGSCEHELPMLQGLANSMAERGVRVLLVSVDEPADHAKAEAFLKDNGIHLTSYLAARPLGPFKAGMSPSWPGMLPASFLFDGAGKLRHYWGGEAFENEVVPVVEGLLAGDNIDGESRFPLAPGRTTDSP